MSADSVPSPKTNIFQSKLYTLIYCRHFRTYSRCAMFDWSDTVFRRRNVTLRRISNTVLQPRYWGSEADSPEVCRLQISRYIEFLCLFFFRLSLPVHSVNIESLFFRSSLPVHTVNRFHGTSNFFVCLVTIKTDINLHKTCTYYKIELKCSYISRRTTHFWNK
jgi:hypothetical protein